MPEGQLHIVSWNVASWQKTLVDVIEWHGSLENYLDKLDIDVLALQEVKCQSKEIVGNPKTYEANLQGWQSFWSPCKLKESHKGFNGVATFARDGLTCSADSQPLGDKALDMEGRCLMTDHGKFCMFNVYIPYQGSGGARLAFKLKFLSALQAKMEAVRSTGKAVILVGDFNVKLEGRDSHPARGLVYVDELLQGDQDDDQEREDAPASIRVKLRALLGEHWPGVQQMLATAEIRSQEVC
jgi:exodeoxyribonuclease III